MNGHHLKKYITMTVTSSLYSFPACTRMSREKKLQSCEKRTKDRPTEIELSLISAFLMYETWRYVTFHFSRLCTDKILFFTHIEKRLTYFVQTQSPYWLIDIRDSNNNYWKDETSNTLSQWRQTYGRVLVYDMYRYTTISRF